MPKEYWDFVFLNETETVEGMHKALDSILSKPKSELHNFGKAAKSFVLDMKNNKIQAARMLQFCDELNS